MALASSTHLCFCLPPPTVPCDILTRGIDHQYKLVFISVGNCTSAVSLLHSVSDKTDALLSHICLVGSLLIKQLNQ